MVQTGLVDWHQVIPCHVAVLIALFVMFSMSAKITHFSSHTALPPQPCKRKRLKMLKKEKNICIVSVTAPYLCFLQSGKKFACLVLERSGAVAPS